MYLDGARNLDPSGGISGRAMRHRQHRDQRLAIRFTLDRERNDARAIFAPLVQSASRFVIPHVGVGNDEARFGRGNRYAARYFGSRGSSR